MPCTFFPQQNASGTRPGLAAHFSAEVILMRARMLASLCCVGTALLLAGCSVTCTPESCSNGCCGSDGICYMPDPNGDESNTQCGVTGTACVDCTATGQTCSAGACDAGIPNCISPGQGCAGANCCAGLVCLSQSQQCGTCIASGSGNCGASGDCCSDSCNSGNNLCN
jgi:hypothetical protein